MGGKKKIRSRVTSDSGAARSSQAHSSTTKQKKFWGSMTPVYIIAGLILGGVLISGMIAKYKRGEKGWREKCAQTNECADGICFPDEYSIQRCMPVCSQDKPCPIGYKCESRAHPKRRNLGMVSICIEKK
jgi:hypothetical protein